VILLPVLAFASHLNFVFVGRETVVDISGVRPAGRFPSGYAVIHSNASYRIPVLPTPNHHIAIRPDPFSKPPSVFPQPIHIHSSHLQHLQGYTSRILQKKYLGPTTPYPSIMPLSSPLLRFPFMLSQQFSYSPPITFAPGNSNLVAHSVEAGRRILPSLCTYSCLIFRKTTVHST
jgi:hypothetical protein